MSPNRHPGVHEIEDERVLLVCKSKITGAERVDWWPSVEEAEKSNMNVLEVRDRVRVEKRKKDWKGLASILGLLLWRSGTQDYYTRERTLDQEEFFEPVAAKKSQGKKWGVSWLPLKKS